MNRTEKEELVSSVQETLKSAKMVVVAQQNGLSVSEVTALRRQMRDNGACFKVLKNTLAKLAVKGTALDGTSSMFKGPTAIAFSQDMLGAAKGIYKFAEKNDKLVIIGGYMQDGDKILSPADVKALALLPSLDELRGKLLGLISGPASKMARILKARSEQEVTTN